VLLVLGLLALVLLLWEIFGGAGLEAPVEVQEIAQVATDSEIIGIAPVGTEAENGFFMLDATGGLSFFNAAGVRVFRHGHGIRGAVLFGSPEVAYVAVVAGGGSVVNLYNTGGLVYSTVIEGTISRFALGANGHAAAIIRRNGGFESVLFDSAGREHLLVHHGDEAGVPMAMALDDSGPNLNLAISFTDIAGMQLNSTITFVTITSGGGQYFGEITAKSLYNPGQIIGGLHFMHNNILLAVADIRIFGIAANGDNLWEIPLNNRVADAAFSGDAFAVAYGAQLLNLDGHTPGTVNVYNTQGGRIFSGRIENAQNISLGFGHIIIQALDTAAIYDLGSGEAIWEGQLPLEAEFMGNSSRIIAPAPGGIRIFEKN
jgi:hypothetical protein